MLWVHCVQTLKLLDSFVMQGDKEEMVTEMIEEPAVIPALLLSWLPFLPCLLAL